YSPCGISPSNVAYSSGWSSVCTARWFVSGLHGRPLGTAHDTSTPSRSSRRSQCRLRAWCSWTTNVSSSPRGSASPSGTGSGVRRASRLPRYSARGPPSLPSSSGPRSSGVTPASYPGSADEDRVVGDVAGDRRRQPRDRGQLLGGHEPAGLGPHPLDPARQLRGDAGQQGQRLGRGVVDVHEPAVVVLARQVGAADPQLLGEPGVRGGQLPRLLAQQPLPLDPFHDGLVVDGRQPV